MSKENWPYFNAAAITSVGIYESLREFDREEGETKKFLKTKEGHEKFVTLATEFLEKLETEIQKNIS